VRARTVAFIVVGVAVMGACALILRSHSVDTDGSLLRGEDFGLDDDDPPSAPSFDPDAPTRTCGRFDVNDSCATFELAAIGPGQGEDWLDELHPSYAAARAGNRSGTEVLPSLNAIDGKAKQFDDGLYAALDLAYYRGLDARLRSHVDVVRRLLDRVGPGGPSAPFLVAALRIAGQDVHASDDAAAVQLRAAFLADESRSKPFAFYTWSRPLADCFRFVRILSTDLPARGAVASDMAKALAADSALRDDYARMLAFYARLTNPFATRSLLALEGAKDDESAAFLPTSSSYETTLFERLFPNGLPPDAQLMKELIARVRSGEVDLAPRSGAGWYDRQVFALETLLLTEKAEERKKLAFTKGYKERLLQAFAALLTKRRETHALHQSVLSLGESSDWSHPPEIWPRLRLEPCLTYYLRTARAYSFLADFLESTVGVEGLRALHGLREGGERPLDLETELQSMRDLFYGCYLVGAEDLGMTVALAADEPVDRDRCRAAALAWIEHAYDDPDLAADTRVSVPVYVDPQRRATRLWATLGVRLAKIRFSYARNYPMVRESAKADGWRAASDVRVMPTDAWYLIPVDEFAEFEIPRVGVLTREEFRAVCDKGGSRDAIIRALREPTR
jgi:hypothetical protein